jgi:hypothetical protein
MLTTSAIRNEGVGAGVGHARNSEGVFLHFDYDIRSLLKRREAMVRWLILLLMIYCSQLQVVKKVTGYDYRDIC